MPRPGGGGGLAGEFGVRRTASHAVQWDLPGRAPPTLIRAPSGRKRWQLPGREVNRVSVSLWGAVSAIYWVDKSFNNLDKSAFIYSVSLAFLPLHLPKRPVCNASVKRAHTRREKRRLPGPSADPASSSLRGGGRVTFRSGERFQVGVAVRYSNR